MFKGINIYQNYSFVYDSTRKNNIFIESFDGYNFEVSMSSEDYLEFKKLGTVIANNTQELIVRVSCLYREH